MSNKNEAVITYSESTVWIGDVDGSILLQIDRRSIERMILSSCMRRRREGESAEEKY